MLILIVCFISLILIKGKYSLNKLQKQNKDGHPILGDFLPSKKVVGINSSKRINKVLAIDDKNNYICFITKGLRKQDEYRKYKYDNIISCEIIEDNCILAKTSRLVNQLKDNNSDKIETAADINTYKLPKKSETPHLINKLGLRIIIDDNINPNFEIYFVNAAYSTSKNDHFYKVNYNICSEWFEILSNIINDISLN
jgi:hypothetical protein